MYRQDTLDKVCKYRNLPKLTVGTCCKVNGRPGIIVGGNTSANLSVLFDDDSCVKNCNPGYKMRIFNSVGGLVYESDD